jgi:hypothetical protein
VRLMPSPDFIEGYEKKQWGLRVGAFIATGVAVAGIATFAIMQGQAQGNYGSPTREKTFEWYRAQLQTTWDEGQYSEAVKLQNQINTQLAISYVAGGVGLASAVAATALFLIGEDPNKYQSYRGLKTSAWVTPNGAGSVWSFDF